MKQLLLLTAILLSTIQANSQPTNLTPDSLRLKVETLSATYDSLLLLQTENTQQAETLAQKIKQVNSRENLNAREHKNLEKLLQKSRELELVVTEVARKLEITAPELTSRIESLIASNQSQVDKLVSLIETKRKNGEDITLQEDLLNNLMSENNKLSSRLRQPVIADQNQQQVRESQWDTPQKLRLKGDILLDQEDAIRYEIARMDKKVQSLQKEKNLRSKMNELDLEVDLFNEQEERLTNNAVEITNDMNNEFYGGAEVDYLTETRDGETLNLTGLADYSEPIDDETGDRSPAYLQQTIDRLKIIRKRMSERADSLGYNARQLHDKADSVEKQ